MPVNPEFESEQFEEGTMMITCAEKSCGKSFPFSPGEQKFFAERGLFPPKRCPMCRMKKKRNQQNAAS